MIVIVMEEVFEGIEREEEAFEIEREEEAFEGIVIEMARTHWMLWHQSTAYAFFILGGGASNSKLCGHYFLPTRVASSLF